MPAKPCPECGGVRVEAEYGSSYLLSVKRKNHKRFEPATPITRVLVCTFCGYTAFFAQFPFDLIAKWSDDKLQSGQIPAYVNRKILAYIGQNYPEKSRDEIDLQLAKENYSLTDIEISWQYFYNNFDSSAAHNEPINGQISTNVNTHIFNYILQNYAKKSRYEIDLQLIEEAYNPKEIEIAWQYLHTTKDTSLEK